MANIWLYSDPHLGHEGTACVFKRRDGTPLRPFVNAEEQDIVLRENYNKLVKPSDKVYWLGDVAMRRQHLEQVAHFNGHKRLVRGNHDIYATKDYLKYFDDVYGVRVFDDMILSHIPLHPDSMKSRWLANVHGHLHDGEVMDMVDGAPDPRYLNVCVERADFRPIAIEEVRQLIRKRQNA